MTAEEMKGAAEYLRDLAEEIESGKWTYVEWETINDHVEKNRRAAAPFQGVVLVGRHITIRMRRSA